jgi:O-antigen/teichoic acid export membrane protein
MSTERPGSQRRSYGRSAGLLTVALGIAGILTYAYFAIASHSLDAEQYGNIVILWSVVFLLASTLFRPIEQLLTRTLAEREQVGAGSADALRAAAVIQGSVCLVAVLVLLLARGPIERELFAGEDVLYWILVASLLGFGLAYYARGFLAGRGQFRLYAALLVIEVSTRLAFAVGVAAGVASGANFVALGIATAPIAVIVVLPIAVVKRRERRRPKLEQPGPDASTQLTLGRGGAFAGAVLVMMLSEQVMINSGALFVRAAEGAAAAGFIFNVMMVARAPLVLFQAIAASLLPHLTRLRARGGDGSRAAFRSSVEATLLLIAGFAALTIVGVVAIGPQVMQIAFGDSFEYDRLGLAIVAAGMGFYLAAASLNQAALAQAQAHRAAACWIFAAAVFVLVNLIGVPSAERAVEIGFAVSAALLAGLLYALYARPSPSEQDVIEPGSGRELQAQLTSADEIA